MISKDFPGLSRAKLRVRHVASNRLRSTFLARKLTGVGSTAAPWMQIAGELTLSTSAAGHHRLLSGTPIYQQSTSHGGRRKRRHYWGARTCPPTRSFTTIELVALGAVVLPQLVRT